MRGEMQNFQELRFADLAQRLLRDVTRLVRPQREAQHVLLATPPNDPNQLGLAILELLLFTEGVNCLTLGAGVPAQEIAGAAAAYKTSLVVLLFDRGISGKIAGQEIRALRTRIAAGLSARGQRARGESAGEADRRRAHGRRLQLGHVEDARARNDASTGSAVAAAAVAAAGFDAGGLILTAIAWRPASMPPWRWPRRSLRFEPSATAAGRRRAILRQLQLGVDPLHPDAKSDDRADHRMEPSRVEAELPRLGPARLEPLDHEIEDRARFRRVARELDRAVHVGDCVVPRRDRARGSAYHDGVTYACGP